MPTKHSFGRIGQMVTRASANYDDVEIVAVNDPFTDLEYMVRETMKMFSIPSSIDRHAKG